MLIEGAFQGFQNVPNKTALCVIIFILEMSFCVGNV